MNLKNILVPIVCAWLKKCKFPIKFLFFSNENENPMKKCVILVKDIQIILC